MQSAQLPHLLHSGPQIKMVSIAQEDLYPELFQDVLRNAFDRRYGPHGHEYWRLDDAVGRGQPAGAGGARSSVDLKRKGHSWIVAIGKGRLPRAWLRPHPGEGARATPSRFSWQSTEWARLG